MLRYPEDKLTCEHICDTVVYECISRCGHNTSCMRECWIEHDKCAISCPCNENCQNGCPSQFPGHPCNTWFCQNKEPFTEYCARENDRDRESCPDNSQGEKFCVESGCCWTPFYNDNSVPWCHYPKIEINKLP